MPVIKDKCPTCDGQKDNRANQCSMCRMKYNHPRETGKWRLNKINGYMCKRINGIAWYEHRYVMTKILGRPLKHDEHVHHIDGNKKNNNPENLQLLFKNEHHKEHMTSDKAKKMSKLGHKARWGYE